MRLTYIYKCGDCPMYTPDCPAGSSNGKPVPVIPQRCSHPDNDNITLGGPEVMPHHCPMLTQPLAYKSELRRKPQ